MDMKTDLYGNNLVRRGLSPVSVSDNTAQVSQIIDMQGHSGVLFAILLGSLADANATFTVLLEEGDDSALSDNTAVADKDMHGTETLAGFQFDDDNEVRSIGYRGNKRYVRLTITPVGNTSAALLAVAVIMGGPAAAPVAQTTSAS